MHSSTIVDSKSIEALATGYGALADPSRLRVLTELARGSRCVCELQQALGVAPNLLSYHLRVLREAELIKSQKRGRWVDYELSSHHLAVLRDALEPPEQG